MADTIPRTTPEANGCRRWASTMAKQQEGHHRHVVAPGGQRQGGSGQDGDDLEGAHLAPAVGRAEEQRGAGHQQRGQAEEDPGVGQHDVVLLLARYAEHRHERAGRARTSSRRHRPGTVVTTLPLGLVTSWIGVLPLGHVWPARSMTRHLGLDVRPGSPSERQTISSPSGMAVAPANTQTAIAMRATQLPADARVDAASPPVRPGPARAPRRPGRRSHRAEEERAHGQLGPLAVEGQGRGADGDEGECRTRRRRAWRRPSRG